MRETAFEAAVSTGVASMIERHGNRATDQARVDLLRALDDGAPEVAVAYEICLRLIERQSRYRLPIPPASVRPGMIAWLRSWFPAAQPVPSTLTSEPAR